MTDDYTTDDFLGGRIRLKQPVQGLRATSDAVLAAAAVPIKPGESVLDVGAGSGVIGLCLAERVADIQITAVEVQPDLCRLIRENARLNQQKIAVVNADIQASPAPLHGIQFDHVVTNPPFYTEARARRNTEQAKAYHQEIPLNLWLTYCLKHVRHKGTFTLIHRPEALPEILTTLSPKLGALEVIPLIPKAGRAAKRLLIRGIVGSRKPLTLSSGLILHQADNDWSPEAASLLRDGKAFPF